MAIELINTIIPQVPEKWTIDKIKHQVQDKPYSIVDGPFGTQLHNDEYVDEGVPVIRIVNLNYNGQFDPEKLVFITEEKYKALKRSSVEKGDLIIAKTGATIGKVGVFEGYEKGIIASSCLKISLNNNISPDFFKYYLISDYCQKQIILSSSGSTRDTINMEQISNLKLVLPQDMKLQQQIANYLDKQTAKIDATIAKNEELIDLLKEKRVALINQVVTKGLNPDVPMKDSGIEWIGEIPEHWNANKLKFLLDKLTDGAHSSVEIIDEGYPYVTVADLDEVNEYVDIDNCKRISKEDYDFLVRNGCKPAIGDILFSQIGTIGLVVPVDNFDDFVLLSSVAILTLSRNINRRWVIYFLKSLVIKNQWRQLLAGGAVKRITLQHISNFITVVPPLVEQKEISKYLDIEVSKINKTISKIQENITLLEEYKTSLIHHVVTGKIDVRGDEI